MQTTISEMAEFLDEIQNRFPRFEVDQPKIEMWHRLLGSYRKSSLERALDEYTRKERWVPKVADLVTELSRVAGEPGATKDDGAKDHDFHRLLATEARKGKVLLLLGRHASGGLMYEMAQERHVKGKAGMQFVRTKRYAGQDVDVYKDTYGSW